MQSLFFFSKQNSSVYIIFSVFLGVVAKTKQNKTKKRSNVLPWDTIKVLVTDDDDPVTNTLTLNNPRSNKPNVPCR